MTDMPKGPWETLHLDFNGPLPSGKYLLVAIDRYSCFPKVKILKSTIASVVILKLDNIFATLGIPTIVKTDNGPPFNGEEYSCYLKALGIKPQIFNTPMASRKCRSRMIHATTWKDTMHSESRKSSMATRTKQIPATILLNTTYDNKCSIEL